MTDEITIKSFPLTVKVNVEQLNRDEILLLLLLITFKVFNYINRCIATRSCCCYGLSVDEEAELASRYGIQGIPVIKFFCEGKEVGEIVGYLPQDALKKEIENISRNAPNCLANTSLMK
jgi:hypothetical protein